MFMLCGGGCVYLWGAMRVSTTSSPLQNSEAFLELLPLYSLFTYSLTLSYVVLSVRVCFLGFLGFFFFFHVTVDSCMTWLP